MGNIVVELILQRYHRLIALAERGYTLEAAFGLCH